MPREGPPDNRREGVNSNKRESLKNEIISLINSGKIKDAIKLKNDFESSGETITNDKEVLLETQNRIIKILSDFSKYPSKFEIINIENSFGFSTEFIKSPETQELAKKSIMEVISSNYHTAVFLKKTFAVSNELFTDPESQMVIQNIITRKFNDEFAYGSIATIAENFPISQDFIKDPEIQEKIKKIIIEGLNESHFYWTKKMSDALSMSDDFIHSPAVKGAVRAGIKKEQKEKVKVPTQKYPEAVKSVLNNINQIKNDWGMSEDDVQDAIIEWLDSELGTRHNQELAVEIIKNSDLPKEKLKDVVESNLLMLLKKASWQRVLNICEKIGIDENFIQNSETQDSAVESVREIMGQGVYYAAMRIKEKFNIPDSVLDQLDMQEAANIGLAKNINRLDFSTALKIKEKFNISDKSIEEIIKDILLEKIDENSYTSYLIGVSENFKISHNMLNDNEVRETFKDNFINSFKTDEGLQKTINVFKVINNNENLSSLRAVLAEPEIIEEAKNKIKSLVLKGDIHIIQEIVSSCGLNKDDVALSIKPMIIEYALDQKNFQLKTKFRNIFNLKEFFSISENETSNIIKEILIKSDNYKFYLNIKKIFSLPDSFMEDEKIRLLIKKWIIELLNDSFADEAVKLIKETGSNSELITDVDIQTVAKRAMDNKIKGEDSLAAGNIAREFNLAESDVQEIVEKWILKRLDQSHIAEVISLKNNFNVSEEFIRSPNVQKLAKKEMLWILNMNGGVADDITENFKEIQKQFLIDNETANEIVLKSISNWMSVGKIYIAINLKERLEISDAEVKLGTIKLIKLNELSLGSMVETEETKKFFTENILGLSWKYIETLSLGENILIKKRLVEERGLDLNKIDEHEVEYDPQTENDYEYIFENIKNMEDSVWTQEDHEIKEAFETGALYFGYKKMFKFVGGKNHHDKLFAFKKVINMAQKSGLKPEQFYANILLQVQRDAGNYGVAEEYMEEEDDGGEAYETLEINSYQKLNNIADVFENIDVLEKLKKATEYEIKKIKDLVDQIKKPGDIFINWKSLKNFADLIELLNKSEILEQLKDLSGEGKEKLKDYVEYLAFHPNINTQSVIEFWQNPSGFLGVGDEHASRTHELKKPSNYTEIPYMDLRSEDLRDALIEGSLDQIQAWQPLEIEYKIPQGEITHLSFVDQMKKALGSRGEKITGIAKNPGVLFKKLNDLSKKERLNLMEIIKGQIAIPENLQQDFQSILYNGEYGLALPIKEYRMKIGLKSDPEVVVAGNDTACCMPFGSGKNNVYMYNPVCGQLVVQRKSKDGEWKTVAQSVVTKDRDIKVNVADLLKKLNGNEKTSLNGIFSDDVLVNEKDIMTCDNIEVSPNFRDITDLEVLYDDFFSEYAKHYGEKENLDTNRVVIGTGYTDASIGQNIDNTFVPTAPVGYSDNIGKTAKVIDLTKQKLILQKKLSAKNKPSIKKIESSIQGISDLTYADTLSAAYIEGKAYDDNSSLKEYLHNIENGLIAKDILNSHFNLPNMALKYEDEKKKTQGYLLAYEGSVEENEKVIYVADLAANTESKLAGGKLIKAFIERYKSEYIDKNRFIPILANARDKTSYQIILKQLESIGKDIGVRFELEEVNSYKKGNDTMRTVLIRPITD
ncbi:MAG: hypothetical protein R3B39_02445 [Candidatus Paceibacterota bacterium]